MKHNVPFYTQTNDLNCGPTALKMAFEFLGKTLSIEEISSAAGIVPGKAVSTVRLALASAKLGFKTTFLSKSLFFDQQNASLDFYKQYGDINLYESQQLIQEAKTAGIILHEKQIPLAELLSHVTSSSIPIVLLDWGKITGKGSYLGHFVPIVGYDETSVIVHNQGMHTPTPFLQIPKETFEQARIAQGTDEDIIIVSKD